MGYSQGELIEEDYRWFWLARLAGRAKRRLIDRYTGEQVWRVERQIDG